VAGGLVDPAASAHWHTAAFGSWKTLHNCRICAAADLPNHDGTAAPERRLRARLSTCLRVVGRRGYGPTRERLSVCLCIDALGVNARICRDERLLAIGL
jgi:hypothetical protein